MVAGDLLAGPSSVLLASCLEEPMEEVREGVSTSELCLRDGLVIYRVSKKKWDAPNDEGFNCRTYRGYRVHCRNTKNVK